MNNDIEENKIEKRLLMPTVGNVSVGKSCFLNALFGINCLQVQSDITTKFILFIRHIDGLKEPELFNVIPIKNKDSDSYDFYKNGDVIIGEKNIIIKINEINSKVSNNCFFMLKIEIKSIKIKNF
jgi:GTPase SAR1 family protein